MYVRTNEQTFNLRIMHVCLANPPPEFEEIVAVIDRMYPKLKIDFVSVEGGTFDQAMVQWISQTQNIPTNMMFIRQPDKVDGYKVSMLGVRVITS